MVVHHRDSAFYKIEEVHTRLVIIDYNKVSFKEGFYQKDFQLFLG